MVDSFPLKSIVSPMQSLYLVEKICSEKSTERSSGLTGIILTWANRIFIFTDLGLELKHILSHSKNAYEPQFYLKGYVAELQAGWNRKDLNDKGYHKMFEAIFRAAMKEKTLYTRQQKTSLKKTIANRLSLCGSVFRLAVELGVKQIRSKTFKAVYKHIVDILPQTGEGLCEPISLDYIKALRVCLEYTPHAEHLTREDWETLAGFCCTHVESQLGLLNDEDEDDDDDSDEDMDSHGVLPIRNPRPSLILDTSSASKVSTPPSQAGVRLNHNSEELLLCLQILLRTPNAPVVQNNRITCKTILGFLTSQPTVTRAHQAALSALNSILEVITTNNIALSSKVAEAIVPVITKLWDSKSPAIREQMIITLIYIQPYLRKIMRNSTGSHARNFRRKLEALSEVLFAEYSARAERDQLQLDDLRFPSPCQRLDVETTPLGLPAYCLRNDVSPRTEQQWVIPQLMAMVIETLDRADGGTTPWNRSDEQNSSKRRKVSKHFDELLRSTRSTINSRKISALLTLPFLVGGSRRNMDHEEFLSIITDLLNACSDENPVISSWAMLSIAR